MNIDLKDRKILYHLDTNCRQSNTHIGKHVGLKKDVVSYRINNLLKNDIISNFYAEINTFRLGYQVFRIYINFQYVNPVKKREIIDYFVNYKNSWVVGTVKSEIDFCAVIWVKDIYEFYQFWNKTLDKYEEFFSKYYISIYIQATTYRKSYLLYDKEVTKDHMLFRIQCGGKSVDIDKLDYSLLNELADNARTPLVDLAEKLQTTSQTISNRIKYLLKNDVIKTFRVNLNLKNIGLQQFKVDIYLREHKYKKPIFKYLSTNPSLQFMNFSIGWSDLGPEFVVSHYDDLYRILDDINLQFPNSIKKHSFFIIDKIYKIRCLPVLF
jgi:DNA-binding Lrp family transcriptional regulator